ncbi:MAG: hypothetical protein WCR52_05170 [Bacteroidota bacterium]
MEHYLFRIKSIVEHLEKRPGMFLVSNTFNAFINFLGGYTMAIYEAEGFSFDRAFSEWLAEKYNLSPALAWHAQILHKTNKNEEAALNLVFLEINAYLNYLSA